MPDPGAVVGAVHAQIAGDVLALVRRTGGKRGAAVDPLAVRIVHGYPLAEYRACAGLDEK